MTAALAGETRTLSLYQVHTKEKLTVTYKKNGRYIPSAMKKLNWILRDWRRDAVTRIDPKTIDLMWELHADLGSRKPIHIISAYRSSKTNAMLKRIGRRVARRSRHIKGQAIDMYFPDIPSSRVRGSALVRRVGGVGYYPRSGKHGFVHIDSGNVRHWPRMSKSRLAKVIRSHRKTVGARRYRKQPSTLFAAATAPSRSFAPATQQVKQAKKTKPSGPTSITPGALSKLAAASATPPPRPRSRPAEVVQLAQAQIETPAVMIVPANAKPTVKNYNSPTYREDGIGDLLSNLNKGDLVEKTDLAADLPQKSNAVAKASFTTQVLKGTADGTPVIRPLLASVTPEPIEQEETSSWWPFSWFTGSTNSLVREDGAGRGNQPGDISATDAASLNRMATTIATDDRIVIQTTAISGKSDMLKVNRSGKGDLLTPAPVSLLKRKTSEAIQFKGTVTANLDPRDEAILQSGDKPLSFE